MSLPLEIILIGVGYLLAGFGVWLALNLKIGRLESEVASLRKDVDETKTVNKELSNTLGEMRETMHSLDKTISRLQMMIELKFNA